MAAIEQVRFLAASEHRVDTLRSLTAAPMSAPELCDELDVSRATVHRVLGSFEEFGWVRRGDEGYRTTSAGQIVLRRFEDVCDAVVEVDSLSDFLAAFERAHDLPLPITEYHVETATPTDPYAATEYFIESVPTDSSRLDVLLPTIVPAFNRACEPLVEQEASIRLLLAQSAAETTQQSYPDDFEQACSLDCVSLWISPESFGFGLSVFDEDVFLGGYDDSGHLQSVLHSTDDDLREWALSVFESFLDDAVAAERAAGATE